MFPCFLELVYGSCVEREEAGERELYVCAMLEQNADSVRYNPVCRCVCNLLDLVFPSGAWKEILKKKVVVFDNDGHMRRLRCSVGYPPTWLFPKRVVPPVILIRHNDKNSYAIHISRAAHLVTNTFLVWQWQWRDLARFTPSHHGYESLDRLFCA